MMRNPAVWMIEQDAVPGEVPSAPQQRASLRNALRSHGFDLRLLADIDILLRRLQRERPDVLLLEYEHADDTILHCCRNLRDGGDDVPIVVLAGTHHADDFIRAFDAGADDCVAHSCDPRELAARLRAVVRRRRTTPRGAPVTDVDAIAFGDCKLDLATRRLYRGEQLLALTSGEFALLAALLRNPHRSLSRERLMELARGPGVATTGRSIDVQVSRLRKLVEADPTRPRFIQTVWGHGYVFVPDILAENNAVAATG